ncbi:MAG TPA: transposase, partial [Anaerolineae bacterium]|nr:transposase [Anaerolineae bacterium]
MGTRNRRQGVVPLVVDFHHKHVYHTARRAAQHTTLREVVRFAGHPFYEKLNEVLGKEGFDEFVEDLCERFYAGRQGRPSVPPGVYFRMLMIGYFEGLDSERSIAWRVSDSL